MTTPTRKPSLAPVAALLILLGAACGGGGGGPGTTTAAGSPPPPSAPAPTIAALDVHGAPPAGGTTVVISGTGFDPGLSVTFGGVDATAVSVDAQAGTIHCTTPARPQGAYDVVVTNRDGQAATFTPFYFEPPPAPTTFFPGSGAPGSSLTVEGTLIPGMTGATRITVGGVEATITLSVQLGHAATSPVEDTVTVPALPPGSYPVVAINPDGQQGTAPGLFVVP